MKEEAKSRLIKDLILAVVAWIVFGALMGLALHDVPAGIACGFIFAGVPFGWRWMSKLITAVGFFTLVIKAILALILGWLAIFVVIIGDIIAVVKN